MRGLVEWGCVGLGYGTCKELVNLMKAMVGVIVGLVVGIVMGLVVGIVMGLVVVIVMDLVIVYY